MRNTVIKLFILSFALIGSSHAQKKVIHHDIQKIVKLLNSGNSSMLLNMMADSCKIGNLPTTIDKQKVLSDILSNFKGIDSYDLISDRMSTNGNQSVTLLVNYKNGGRGKPIFVFNKDGKLTELGIIKVKLSANAAKVLATTMANTLVPDTMRIKFELFNGLIYVPAKFNGIDGFFMFDSGAPIVMLRKKYVPKHAINKDVSLDFTGMGGNMVDVNWSTGNSLHWGDLLIKSLDAPVVSLPEMDREEAIVGPLFGLLGYGIFSGFQVAIDYSKQELLFEKVDQSGNFTGSSFTHGEPLATIPIRMKRHIPIIDLSIGGKRYPMGIDCGANSNLLKKEVVLDLSTNLKFEGNSINLLGVGKEEIVSELVYLQGAQVGSFILNSMPTVITDQAIGAGQGEQQLPMIGLLGTPFLNQFKTVFNFQKGYLYLY